MNVWPINSLWWLVFEREPANIMFFLDSDKCILYSFFKEE